MFQDLVPLKESNISISLLDRLSHQRVAEAKIARLVIRGALLGRPGGIEDEQGSHGQLLRLGGEEQTTAEGRPG